MLRSICTRPSKTGFFSYDMRRAGMVIGIGKVCQHPCVVVPAYLPTDDVLDLDVVLCCKIVTASVALLHIFFLNRKQLLWLNRK